MKILITDIFKRKTFDLVNILIKKKYKKNLLFTLNNKNNLSRIKANLIYSPDNIEILRKNSQAEFDRDLIKIYKKYKNEKIIYIPIEEETTLFFYSFIKKNNEKFYYQLPSIEVYELSRNKEKLNHFCISNNINVPEIINEINIKKEDFPLILKPKIGMGSEGIKLLNNINEYNELNYKRNKNFFFQKYIKNNKNVNGAFLIYNNNDIISYHNHKRIRTFPTNGGVTIFSKIYFNKEILFEVKKILKKLKWRGIIMIEFIYDENDKKYKLIEINPRIWGSILGSEISNSNLIENYINLCLDKKIINNKIKKSYVRWILPYEIINWLKRKLIPLNYLFRNNNTAIINITYSNYIKSFLFHIIEYSNKIILKWKKL